MKHLSKALLCIWIGFLGISGSAIAQETSSGAGIGIGIKASTNGIGGDLVYLVGPQFGLRLGLEKMGYATAVNFSEQNIDYLADVSIQAGSISLLADFYLGKFFFLTAGAGYNLFEIQAAGKAINPLPFGDIEISPEMIGEFEMTLKPGSQISPYMGIGFGRTLGSSKALGFAFELGGFYQGSPDLTIVSSGLLSPTSNPLHGQEARLEKQIRQYNMYPVLKISLNYKIISL